MPSYSKTNIDIVSFPSGALGTNAYLVICKKTNKAALIDAPEDSLLKITRECQKRACTLEKLILTHSHWDHIAEASLYKMPAYIHPEDAYNLKSPGSDKLKSWLSIEGVEPTGYLKEGDVVHIGDSSWEIIHTPGHSPGGICLYCEEEGVLISGDTLFKGSLGRIDLPTSEPERMWPSLKKLSFLPKETQVFPGHGAPTTIGAENWLANAEQIFQ
ncbi:MAG: MBL fold metallo-hydrolase [Chlamydiales bacterium]|nr:MBL fold metallo-hydrolase [Chlamydiales bacterium]